ncbi:MAG: WbqC family protein [Bacteroidetes bacterium]|nr:WbqC family protein [Bacteroidota bacterium]
MHLFSLHYLPQIKYLKALLQAEEIAFEMMEHFQRQTYRNRCEIYTADGIHKLIVPVSHNTHQKERSCITDVRIAYHDNWRLQHLRTIKSAYQSSSYFEYFESDFIKLYEKKHEFLVDFNIASLEIILGFLKKPLVFTKTIEYIKNPSGITDLREAFTDNNYTLDFEYYQVFQGKKGVIGNLSSIDLLFNAGPQRMLELLNLSLV